jgi:hypothetical protein
MAAVAQLVERQIVALNVAGSIPVGRPKIPHQKVGIFFNLWKSQASLNNHLANRVSVEYHKKSQLITKFGRFLGESWEIF